MSYSDKAAKALEEGLDIQTVVSLPARERIGRLKYAAEDAAADEFTHCLALLDEELGEELKAAEDAAYTV